MPGVGPGLPSSHHPGPTGGRGGGDSQPAWVPHPRRALGKGKEVGSWRGEPGTEVSGGTWGRLGGFLSSEHEGQRSPATWSGISPVVTRPGVAGQGHLPSGPCASIHSGGQLRAKVGGSWGLRQGASRPGHGTRHSPTEVCRVGLERRGLGQGPQPVPFGGQAPASWVRGLGLWGKGQAHFSGLGAELLGKGAK